MEGATKTEKKTRPYWHVDAKWMCSLAFIFFFSLTLFAYGLYQITNEKNGINLMTKMITLTFSRTSVDDPKDTDQFLKKIEAAPNKTIQPIPTLNITLSKSEIEGKSPREIRYTFFRKIATPIYFNGKGAEDVLNSPEARANFQKDTSLLRMVSEESHKRIGTVLLILAVISTVFLGLVVLFSKRFGRVANPGYIIAISTWFWALIFFVLKGASANVKEIKLPIPGEAGTAYGQMITPFVKEILPDIFAVLSKVFMYAFAIGVVLLIAAGVCKMIIGITNKVTKNVPIKMKGNQNGTGK